MGLKDQHDCLRQRKIIVFTVLAFIPLALFRLCFTNPFSANDDTSLQESAAHVVITNYSSSSQGKIDCVYVNTMIYNF